MTDRLNEALVQDVRQMSRIERSLPEEFIDQATLRTQRITLCIEQPEACFQAAQTAAA